MKKYVPYFHKIVISIGSIIIIIKVLFCLLQNNLSFLFSVYQCVFSFQCYYVKDDQIRAQGTCVLETTNCRDCTFIIAKVATKKYWRLIKVSKMAAIVRYSFLEYKKLFQRFLFIKVTKLCTLFKAETNSRVSFSTLFPYLQSCGGYSNIFVNKLTRCL